MEWYASRCNCFQVVAGKERCISSNAGCSFNSNNTVIEEGFLRYDDSDFDYTTINTLTFFYLFAVTEQYNNGTLPTMEMFRMMRHNHSAYSIFVEKFVSCVIGTNYFKNVKLCKPFQEYCTISDEAMTFLILENNWDVWSEIAIAGSNNEQKPIKSCVMKQKFFDPKTGRGHSWNDAGKDYYNMIFDLVQQDRIRYGKNFDIQLLSSFTVVNEEGLQNKREQRRKCSVQKTIIACKSDYVPKAARGISNININYQYTQTDMVDQAMNPTGI
jgi:hypothetical protein